MTSFQFAYMTDIYRLGCLDDAYSILPLDNRGPFYPYRYPYLQLITASIDLSSFVCLCNNSSRQLRNFLVTLAYRFQMDCSLFRSSNTV